MTNDPPTLRASPWPFASVLGVAQLAALLLQFAGLLWMGGRWSAEMSAVGDRVTELRQIVGELAKSQAQGAIIDASQGARLETLAKRLDEIVMRLDRLDHDRLDLERRDERAP